MTNYYVELTVRIDGEAPIEEYIDPLMEAFEDVDGFDDVDLGCNLVKRTMDVCIHLAANDPADALVKAQSGVRTAVHRIGSRADSFDSFLKSIRSGAFASSVRVDGALAV